MAKKKLSKTALKEINEVLEKHQLKGFGVVSTATAADNDCPEGQKPLEITIKDASGHWITKKICVPA